MANNRVSSEIVNQFMNAFNGAEGQQLPVGITPEIIEDMFYGSDVAKLCEFSSDDDLDDILEYISDDTDDDYLADKAILLFVKNSRFELDLNDMQYIGVIAEEISDDVDLIWGICSQELPRGENMHIRIAKIFDERPDWMDEED